MNTEWTVHRSASRPSTLMRLAGTGRTASPAVLFVNPRSGDGAATRKRVVEQARERGVETVILGPGDDLGHASWRP